MSCIINHIKEKFLCGNFLDTCSKFIVFSTYILCFPSHEQLSSSSFFLVKIIVWFLWHTKQANLIAIIISVIILAAFLFLVFFEYYYCCIPIEIESLNSFRIFLYDILFFLHFKLSPFVKSSRQKAVLTTPCSTCYIWDGLLRK